jgi:glyoxylase-like metal-dependent hydrolase (beta-lactamase superfamily II)
MSSIDLGDFRITLVREAVYYWDGGVLFGVVPRSLWSRKAAPDELNRIPLGFNCYVIETGDHTVLVETGGCGSLDARGRERMKLPESTPALPEVLARTGLDPERIDVVLNTHLHWDHSSGNTRGGQPAFPRAVYYARRGEWEHAHERHPRDSVSYIDSNYDPLVESGRMRLLDGDAQIVPGIRMHHAPGHNRDMMVVTAHSGDRTFCFFSDLVPTAAHLTPTWLAAFDLDPMRVIDQKRHWLGRAAREGWICGFGHDPAIAFTRVSGEGLKFTLVPDGAAA